MIQKELTDEEILFFYKSVFLFNETDAVRKSKWNKKIEEIEKQYHTKIYFTCEKIKKSQKENILYIKKKFINQSHALIFIKHLRNAFAHNNIVKNGDKYCLYDEDIFLTNNTGKNKKEKTMQGAIECDFLRKIVEELNNQV